MKIIMSHMLCIYLKYYFKYRNFLQIKSLLYDEYNNLSKFDNCNPPNFQCEYCRKPFALSSELLYHLSMCDVKKLKDRKNIS